ncbi:MAG: Gfo/Idh/MocA family oxidoreductase [Parcubacteria group bacterium]|nr:Gfo/Idh/MocA family oxidoreductase [Parcubacteria group bacterium]
METNQKISVAIIGVGYWGPNFVRNLSEMEQIGDIFVYDLDSTRVEAIKKKYPDIKNVGSFEEILSNPDITAAFVITPVNRHFEVAKKLLLANKHVFVEKPLAQNSIECEILINLSREKNKALMVGHIMEYKPAIRKIREHVLRGDFGNILYLDAVRINLGLIRGDVSVIWDAGVHDIYTLNFILNKKPVRVSAVGAKYPEHTNVDLESVAFLTLDYGNNLLAHIHINWLSPVKMRKMMICGTKKMLTYDDVDAIEPLKIYDKGLEDDLSYRSGDTFIPKIENEEPLRNECEHFIYCALNNTKPQSDGHSGLVTVKVLEAAEESLKNQSRFVDINYNTNGTI